MFPLLFKRLYNLVRIENRAVLFGLTKSVWDQPFVTFNSQCLSSYRLRCMYSCLIYNGSPFFAVIDRLLPIPIARSS